MTSNKLTTHRKGVIMKSPEQEQVDNNTVAPAPSDTGSTVVKQNNTPLMWMGIGAIVVAGLVSSYLIGYNIAKHHTNKNVAGIERRQEYSKVSLRSTQKIVHTVRGTIESSNATSITVKKTTTGETASYTITSETTILHDGKIATVNDLTTGSTVAIRVKADDSATQKTAKTIIIDPQTATRKG